VSCGATVGLVIDPPAVPLAPGWYDDPESPARLRYFDGAAWTERTSDRTAAASVPQPTPAPSPQAKSSSNVAIWLVVGLLAIIAAPFALAMFAASGADDSLSDTALGLQVMLDEITETPLMLAFAGAALLGGGWGIGRAARSDVWPVLGSTAAVVLAVMAISHYQEAVYRPSMLILVPAGLLIIGAAALLWVTFRRTKSPAAG
jgi:hypothetical protein